MNEHLLLSFPIPSKQNRVFPKSAVSIGKIFGKTDLPAGRVKSHQKVMKNIALRRTDIVKNNYFISTILLKKFLFTTIVCVAFCLYFNTKSFSQTIFYYTGGDQTYTVPANVYCIDVKLWGGGGGAGDNRNGGNGGGGAYVYGRLNVTPGENLTIIVGGGGAAGVRNTGGAYNGGTTYGGGGRGWQDDRGGGNGGGRSAIRRGGTELATAAGGGGGGGSGTSGGNGTRYCGGGGAAVNGTGGRGGDRDGCAYGSGGCGGTPTGNQNCTNAPNGTQFNGGDGENIGNQTYGGAGGGGGWYGGEGGNSGGNNSGGGGGGSSYFSGDLFASSAGNTGNANGSGGGYIAAGNWNDIYNGQNYGGGGSRCSSGNSNCGNDNSNTGLAGQHGRIVIVATYTATAGTLLANGTSGSITVNVGATVNFSRSGGTGTAHYWIADHTNNFMGWNVCDNCYVGQNSFSRTFNESGSYLIRLHPEECGIYNWSQLSDVVVTVRPRTWVETVQAYSIIGNPGSTSLTANAQVDINRGLLVHLPLNGNSMDVSGNGHHATFKAGGYNATGDTQDPAFTQDRFGNYARALYFDGNDFLSIPSLTNLSGDELTIAYWFKGPANYSAVRQQSGAGYIVSGWSTGLHILSHDGGTTNGLNQGAAVRDGNWHHVVFTWQRDMSSIFTWQPASNFLFRAFVDGALVGQRVSGSSPIPNMNTATLIGSYLGTSEFMVGTIDDIRIYRKALTTDEVVQLSGIGQSFSYSWSPSGGLSATNAQSVTASPTSHTTYTASVIFNSGPAGTSASVITVVPPASVTINGGTIYCGSASATTLSVAGSQANLVAYYPFASNLNDISGSGLNLSGSGGSFAGGGLKLTKTSNYTSASTGILNNDNHTIAFYIKFDDEPDGYWRKIFGYEPSGSDRSPGLWMFPSTGIRIHWRYDAGNTGISEDPGYTIGEWYHVAGVKNGATFTLYVDGIAVYTGSVANPKHAGNSILWFGGAPVTLKEFKIFNRSLSAADINAARQWTWYSGTCNGTVAGTGQSITVTPPATTTYFIRDVNTLTNGTGCSANATITINPLPTATISGTTEVCRNAAQPNITFTGASGTPNYTFTYNINGGSNQQISTTGGNASVTLPVPTTTVGTYVYNLLHVSDSSPTNCAQNQSGSATVNVVFPVAPTLDTQDP